MITKFHIDEANAVDEFGMACQRLVPWTGQGEEPPFGAMACFLPAGADSAPDCHDQVEVMIVLSGAGSVDVAEERRSIAAGEMVVIPRNQEHVVRNPESQTLRWVSLYWPLHEPKDGGPA
ncbi:MAG: cupin domain-containing protein [Egibacteraceae bacterium]